VSLMTRPSTCRDAIVELVENEVYCGLDPSRQQLSDKPYTAMSHFVNKLAYVYVIRYMRDYGQWICVIILYSRVLDSSKVYNTVYVLVF